MIERVDSPWRRPPHYIIGLGAATDPIPLIPPPGYAGAAVILTATSKRALKEIPDWELLAFFLRGPDLVFTGADHAWFRDRWTRLYTLKKAARKAAKDGDRKTYDRLLGAARFRWRVLVQRSIGLRMMGGRVVRWP